MNENFKFHISRPKAKQYWAKRIKILQGFTLIEIILTVSIMSVLSLFGVSSYREYNDNKIMDIAVEDIAKVLEQARSRALSQVKPSVSACDDSPTDEPLYGYRVRFCPEGCTSEQIYEQHVVCGSSGENSHVVETYRLPDNITFASAQEADTLFRVLTGQVVGASSIDITGYERSRSIDISATGVLSIAYTDPTPLPTATPGGPTSTPMDTPAPTTPPPPTADISADPMTITSGEDSTLTWSSTDAVGCTALDGWSGAKATSGTQVVSPTTTTTYSIYCTSSEDVNSSTESVTITVNSPPSVVAIDSSSTSSFSGSGSHVWNHTVSGTNRYLIVAVTASNGYVQSVTYNGQALTNISGEISSTLVYMNIWALVNPPTGIHQIDVYSNSSTSGSANAVSLTGVNQSTPIGTLSTKTTGYVGSILSDSFSVAASDMIITAIGLYRTYSITPNSGQSIIISNTTTRGSQLSSKTGITGSTTVGGSWSSNSYSVLVAVPVKVAT